MIYEDLFSGTESNPYAFFDTAAGPDTSDIYGPPMNVLDTFLDGSPVAMSEQYLQNQTPGAMGGGSTSGLSGFFGRADVRSALVLALGLFMLHMHMNS